MLDLLRSIGRALLSGVAQLAIIVLVCVQFVCKVISMTCGAAFLIFALAGLGLAGATGLIGTNSRL